jgi:hypothetical protein
VVLHVDDTAVSETKHLKQLRLGSRGGVSPVKLDDDAGFSAGDDRGVGVDDPGLTDPAESLLEDRPGLSGTVSARRPPPPEMASGDTPPLEVGGEEGGERLDVTPDGGLEGRLDTLGVGHGTSRFSASGYK